MSRYLEQTKRVARQTCFGIAMADCGVDVVVVAIVVACLLPVVEHGCLLPVCALRDHFWEAPLSRLWQDLTTSMRSDKDEAKRGFSDLVSL